MHDKTSTPSIFLILYVDSSLQNINLLMRSFFRETKIQEIHKSPNWVKSPRYFHSAVDECLALVALNWVNIPGISGRKDRRARKKKKKKKVSSLQWIINQFELLIKFLTPVCIVGFLICVYIYDTFYWLFI